MIQELSAEDSNGDQEPETRGEHMYNDGEGIEMEEWEREKPESRSVEGMTQYIRRIPQHMRSEFLL